MCTGKPVLQWVHNSSFQKPDAIDKTQSKALPHLDPHLSQDKVDLTPEDFNLDSYHSKNPRKLHFSKMDPRSVNIFQYYILHWRFDREHVASRS